ncbi:MAG: ferric iron uptake transcriptional regulator [Rhodocyclaceae bacterium]|nr:ferric iron uptake transcriptional regulator [Rhodocyclaceae bacterium]
MPTSASLKSTGLKATYPRLRILELFQKSEARHMTAEDIYRHLLTEGIDIGLATVYRVLTQFEQAGLIERHFFESGKAVFELNEGRHHDHLVCLQCGKVEEFYDPGIERRQIEIAEERGFTVKEHALYLYAECNKPGCEGQKLCPMKSECRHLGADGECPPTCPEVEKPAGKRR